MKFLSEILGYGFASALALVVDTALLFYLVRACHFWPVPAATMSFAAGAVVAYLLASKFAFTVHRLHDRRAEFAIFFLLGLVGLVVNAAIIAIGSRLGFALLASKALAAGSTFLCNFLLRRQMLFVSPKANADTAHVFAE